MAILRESQNRSCKPSLPRQADAEPTAAADFDKLGDAGSCSGVMHYASVLQLLMIMGRFFSSAAGISHYTIALVVT